MARNTLSTDEKKKYRVALSLTQELNANLVTLSKLEGKKPAVLVRDILSEYLSTRHAEIIEAQKADEAYQRSLEMIRKKNTDPAPMDNVGV